MFFSIFLLKLWLVFKLQGHVSLQGFASTNQPYHRPTKTAFRHLCQASLHFTRNQRVQSAQFRALTVEGKDEVIQG